MGRLNAEVLARTIARRICERHPREGDDVAAWIDEHWELVAAQFEAGLINAAGTRTPEYTDEKAFAAVEAWYRKRDEEQRLKRSVRDIFGRLNKEMNDSSSR